MALVTEKCALGCQVLLMVACVGLTTLCSAREPPKTRIPPVDIYDLIIGVSVFPRDGWKVRIGPAAKPERERREIESIYVEFCHESFEQGIGGTWQDVFRYRNELEAANSFPRHGFLGRHLIAPWGVPEQWSYESPAADRFKFACAEIDILGLPHSTCQAVAQYDEYISVFHTHLSPDYMTLDDVERILAAIDERMAFYLQENTE